MTNYLYPLFLLIFVISGITALAQNPPPLTVRGYEYTYDLNGNRVKRTYTDVFMKRGLGEDSTQVEATITSENKITVAPNPTSGILKLDITGKLQEDAPNSLTLVDMKGAPLLEMKIKQNNLTLDLSSYVNGYYFMLVSLNGRSQLFKIIKEN